MELQDLIQDCSIMASQGALRRPVAGLAYHTDQVVDDGIFVAIAGSQTDGHEFIPQALARGARTLVVEEPYAPPEGVTLLRVPSARVALAALANRFYGFPSHRLTVVGVTGTNGKTTTTYFLESILAAAGRRVGVIGTVNIHYGGSVFPAAVTTPESLDLQRNLSAMLQAGVTHVVMEVSSHGLDMHRVDRTRFGAGLFTNLSQDHLDYHGTMERYFAAKARLFTEILRVVGKDRPVALVNGDDPWGKKLCSLITGPLLRYGLASGLEIRADEASCSLSGITAQVETPAGKMQLHSPLLGRLNLYNLLAATSVAVGLGMSLDAIRAGIQNLTQVPGRLETVPNELGFRVLVDYAHTPDALEKALDALRDLECRRLLCVFGCGGDRDRGKRPMMGAAAAERADLVVITSDNPRSEPPQAIMAEIEAGVLRMGLKRIEARGQATPPDERCYTMVVDRREAIRLAVNWARSGDVVYIGGKGHEAYQIIGNRRFDFDDRLVVTAVLEERQREEKKGWQGAAGNRKAGRREA
jgi:UDP-N-acetylmuramoyl-L-alanyl-D-glutamate--2,6-diaminopimelate ligase